MIKYFCDRCGQEMHSGRKMYEGVYDALGVLITNIEPPKHLCDECCAKLDTIKDQIEHEEDIFDMTDEDIELLLCPFKIGDQVITSTGEVGTITSICDCEECKERGFLEPTIETEIGHYSIWITNTDKKNGFKRFYKIGDRIFGNIDEQGLLDDIEYKKHSLHDIQVQLIDLNSQLDVIKKIKETQND